VTLLGGGSGITPRSPRDEAARADRRHFFTMLLRRTAGVGLGNGFSRGLFLAFELFLAVHLAATGYGQFAICLGLIVILSNISLLGLNFGLVQHLSVHQEDGDHEKVVSVAVAGLAAIAAGGAVAGLLVAVYGDWIAASLFKMPDLAPVLIVVAAIIPVEAFNHGMSAVFRGLREFRFHVLVTEGVRSAFLMVSVAFVWLMDLGLRDIVGLYLAGTSLAALAGILKLQAMLRTGAGGTAVALHPRRLVAGFRGLIGFSGLLFASGIFQKIAGRGQVVLAGVFLTAGEVGAFAILVRLSILMVFFQTVVNQTTPVEFARFSHLGDGATLQHVYRRISNLLLLICFIVALPLLIEPRFVLSLIDSGYVPYAWLLVPLVMVQVLDVGTGPVGQLLISAGKQKAHLVSAVFGGAAQVGIAALLMPRIGVKGAVVAQCVAVAGIMAIRHLLAYRLLGVHVISRRFAATAAGGTGAMVAGIAAAALIGGGLPGYALGLAIAYLLLVGMELNRRRGGLEASRILAAP
jgi:O-antigen/teichoic acid export membrane protein